MGHQAALESSGRYFEDAKALDLGHAIADWSGPGWCGTDNSHFTLLSIHASVFVAARLQFGDARHCRRWFLHAGNDRKRTGVLRRYSQHVLPDFDDQRTRVAGDFGRDHSKQ